MDTPVKIKAQNIERLDALKNNMDMTRQNFTNRLLSAALTYVEQNGYGALISLTESPSCEMVQTSK